jgi:hypothetical protein
MTAKHIKNGSQFTPSSFISFHQVSPSMGTQRNIEESNQTTKVFKIINAKVTFEKYNQGQHFSKRKPQTNRYINSTIYQLTQPKDYKLKKKKIVKQTG